MRVHQYALMRDVAASQPRPRTSAAMFAAPPLLVMNQVRGHDNVTKPATLTL